MGTIGAFADDNLVGRKERARKQYSKEELSLLEEKARLIRTNYDNIYPIGVEKVLNESMNFKFDTPPVIKEGRTLVPVRTISEAFEASVEWNPLERRVAVRKGNKEIFIWIGEKKVSVNETKEEIDVPALILNGRAMVPLRFITEKLGLSIIYHEDNGIIEIIE